MTHNCIMTVATIALAGATNRCTADEYPQALEHLQACADATLHQQPLPETPYTGMYRTVILAAFGKIDEGRKIIDCVKAFQRLVGGRVEAAAT